MWRCKGLASMHDKAEKPGAAVPLPCLSLLAATDIGRTDLHCRLCSYEMCRASCRKAVHMLSMHPAASTRYPGIHVFANPAGACRGEQRKERHDA